MIGSLLYLTFDIAFNILLWATVKSAKSLYYISNSIYYYNSETEKINEGEIYKIREQITHQNKLIEELKKNIDDKDKLKKVKLYYDL